MELSHVPISWNLELDSTGGTVTLRHASSKRENIRRPEQLMRAIHDGDKAPESTLILSCHDDLVRCFGARDFIVSAFRFALIFFES